jgi:hypothetical protein
MTTLSYTISADEIVDVAPIYYAAKRTPLFVGSPGCGKTAFVREAAEEIRRRLNLPVTPAVREMHLASMSEVDVRGFLVPVGGNSTFTAPEFWSAVQENPYGILFLDEFPQASHEVQKAVAPLILERRVGEYTLPDGWAVMLAGNRGEDNAGANTLLSHVVNRVSIINVTPPSVDTWVSWAVSAGLPPELIAFAKIRPNIVFEGTVEESPDTPYCTPRSLHALGDIANQYPGGLRALVENRAGMALATATIGAGATTELCAVVRTAVNLPSYEDVVSKPKDTPLPEKPDQLYAMVMLLAVRAKIEDIDAVIEYITRMNINYALIGILSMVRRNKEFLTASKPMRAWVLQNKEHLSKFQKYITEGLSK